MPKKKETADDRSKTELDVADDKSSAKASKVMQEKVSSEFEALDRLSPEELDKLADAIAEKLASSLLADKLADAILENPGLLDALLNYTNRRRMSKKASTQNSPSTT